MSDKKDIPTAEIKADEPILAKKEYAKTERSKSEQGAEKMNTSSNGTPKTDAPKTETVVVKKGGAGLAFLALLVALGVGGAGYYFGQQEVEKINQKLTALESQIGKTAAENASNTLPNIAQDNEQLTKLVNGLKTTDEKLAVLERSLSDKETALSALQTQVTNVATNMNAQPSEWLLSEADFLLNNALRKLLLDNDVETSIALLKISDEVLAKVSEPEAKTVRARER